MSEAQLISVTPDAEKTIVDCLRTFILAKWLV
mgnify:FL=1